MKWKRRVWKIVKWTFGTLLFLILAISTVLYIYKDDIIDYAVNEMNKYLKADVEVQKIDITFWSTFPNLSLDLNHIFVQDALPGSTRRDTLLYTDQIRLKFDPFDIWKGKYHVKRIDIAPGTLQLKVNEQGEVNYNILEESESEGQSEFKLNLEKIHVRHLRFLFRNDVQKSRYSSLVNRLDLTGAFTQDQFTMKTDADLQVSRVQHGLIPFLINQPVKTQVEVRIDKRTKTFSIPKGQLLLADIPFRFDLNLDSTQSQLNVVSKAIPLQEIANRLALRQVKDVQKLQGQGTGFFDLKLVSKLAPDAYPEVNCDFGIQNGRLVEPIRHLQLSNIHLAGNYNTLKGNGKEELSLDKCSFQTVSGPFSGNLKIRNFNKPSYRGAAKGSVNLSVLHAIFKIPKIDDLDGIIAVDSRFACETRIQQEKHYLEIVEGSGNADLKNVSFQLEQDSRQFFGINGGLVLNKSAASLTDLVVKLGESDLRLNGSFDHLDAFLQDESDLDVKVIAESRLINLKNFNNETSPVENMQVHHRDWILPTKIKGQVILDVGTITMNQHKFKQINGEMSVGNRTIAIQKLHGITADATVKGSLNVIESAPEYFDLEANLSSKDIYFKPVFREWNNFEQQVITESNISGRAEAILDLKAPFLMGSGILKDEIIAQIQLKVVNGQLKDVGTFRTLTNDLKSTKTKLVLKSREIDALQQKLNDIRFETLENTIYIKNSSIFIPKMEIKSTAIDITIDGSHTFSNNIDYHFAFRFRELKLQKDESQFGIVEDDGTGFRVYVKMYGNLDNPTVEWDKDARKEQSKENREVAKKEAISILKSEFGLFKKDTTTQKYQPPKRDKEVIQIQFGKEEEVDPYLEKKKIEKEKKGLKKFEEKLKSKQKKEEGNESFTVD